ncbi:MAG TPA: DUF5677 domain-containing protein [Bacteroidia bacterium]
MTNNLLGSNRDEFDNVLKIVIEIGNKLVGKPNLEADTNLVYAEGLGKKIIGHSLSARYLYDGFQIAIKSEIFVPRVDFPSIIILTRAALESYLTFHYLFIAPKNDCEKEFRFLCWDLSGYLDRENAEATRKEYIELKESEKKRILELKKEIREHDYLKLRGEKIIELALDGQWRLKNSWSKLAVNAGFNKAFFDKQYKFLCGYAHSSRLSVIQIQQTKTVQNERNMADASLGVLQMILSKYIYDYVNLIPELKKVVDFNTSEYYKILVWYNVCKSLDK